MGSAVGRGLTVARARLVGRGRRPRETLCACRLHEGALDRAFAERYGIPAINIVNDLTAEAVPPRGRRALSRPADDEASPRDLPSLIDQ